MRKRINLDILYEDDALLVCIKPAGVPVQTAKAGQSDMVSELKNYRAKKKEEPYIGLIHRLDQPVEGIMVFAKTKKAAAKLSEQVSSRQIEKEYMAVVSGTPGAEETHTDGSGKRLESLCSDNDGQWYQLHDYLLKDGTTNTSQVVPEGTPGAKEALLSYTLLQTDPETNRSLVRIRLHTGRHHQIRVQFAHAGFPLYGDTKYGQPLPKGVYCPVALCSCKIGFVHPETGEKMEFEFLKNVKNLLQKTSCNIWK